jgi:hypothetical protein
MRQRYEWRINVYIKDSKNGVMFLYEIMHFGEKPKKGDCGVEPYKNDIRF